MNKPTIRHSIVALCAALAACSGGNPGTQVVTGQIATRGAVAVRAIDGQTIVTASQVRADGTFSLALPSGKRYRIEVLTGSGVQHIYARTTTGLHDLSFKVCTPAAPWDVGHVKPPAGTTNDACDPATDPSCKCDPNGTCCDPTTNDCGTGGGGGCDPLTDPNCKCDPNGTCGGGCDPTTDPNCKCGPDGQCCDPTTDPNCGGGGGGGGCDPTTDPNCKCGPDGQCCDPTTGTCGGGGGGCDPTTDPNCKCDPNGTCCDPTTSDCGGGGGGCTDPTDPNCKCGPDGQCCDPTTDPNCGGGGTSCDPTNDPYCTCDANGVCTYCIDPTDPNTCKDPCVLDPSTCGCKPGDANCWGDPGQPKCDATGMCAANGALMPDHPPADFGCEGSK